VSEQLSSSLEAGTSEGSTSTSTSRPMALITLEQRAALLEFLAKQPYQEVAGGIDFLKNAIIINVNFTGDDAQSDDG